MKEVPASLMKTASSMHPLIKGTGVVSSPVVTLTISHAGNAKDALMNPDSFSMHPPTTFGRRKTAFT